jgi:hypothetical protein
MLCHSRESGNPISWLLGGSLKRSLGMAPLQLPRHYIFSPTNRNRIDTIKPDLSQVCRCQSNNPGWPKKAMKIARNWQKLHLLGFGLVKNA